jgi:hypothetical protein
LIGNAHLRLYELDGSCVIDIAPMSAKAPRQQLKLPLMGHCDVMTMGASQNFAVDARGDARSGKYMVRVVGGLQWQSAVRAECGSAVSDVLVDARARTVSLAPQAAGIAGGYCPRLYNQDRKWP